MSSPSIPRCKSVPSITYAGEHSPSSSDIQASSVKTSKSAESLKSALQKITRKKWQSSSSSSSNNSKLTIEYMKEFNSKQPSSPYYRGLTDQRIGIEKQKLAESSSSSPLRENQSFSVSMSSSFVKIQEWRNSRFVPKAKEDRTSIKHETLSSPSLSRNKKTGKEEEEMQGKEVHDHNSRTDLYTLLSKEKPMREKKSSSSSSSSSSRKRETGTKMTQIQSTTAGKERDKESSRKDLYASKGKEKSLRERVSEQPPPLPPPPITAPSLPPQLPEEEAPRRITLPSPPPTPPVQTYGESSQPPALGKSVAEGEEMVAEEESEMKFIWADKHRPEALKDFLCNKDIALELQAMAKKGGCDKHYIFEGPPGVGKRTMIFALLREVFGPNKIQAREECKVLSLKGESVPSIQVNVKVSMRHIEINLSETKGYEQHVIVELIRGKSNKLSGIPMPCNREDYKAIIICEAEKLSTDSLMYIKWILEKYKGCYKVFFCCSDASKLQPIKSTCRVVQLRSPSDEEIINVLEFIAKEEGVELPRQLAEKFANKAKSNLRQAIRSFEATWHNNSLLKEDQEIMTGWEDDIAKIARNIIEEQSPRQLYDIRKKLQNLIEHNVSAEFIFYTLGEELKKNLDNQLHNDIHNLQQKYKSQLNVEEVGNINNDPLRQTVQQFMKIEEFIAKFMSWYKANVVKKREALMRPVQT